MTFQEAVKIIYSNDENEKISVYRQAIETIKWFENNVLELEDYQTDQLHKVLAIINENKLEVQTMKNENEQVRLTAEQLEFFGKELATIMRTIATQRDLINFLPDPKQGDTKRNALNYITLHNALMNNSFDLFNDIIEKLDNYSLVIQNSTDKEIIEEYSRNIF